SDEISVSKLLKELEDALDAPLSQYDVDFDIAGFELSEMLACNAEVLIGALVSVVVNALQASPQHPVVRVFALKVKQSVVVSVLDRGPGMSDEALHQAQQPFQTTKSQGTGLGLAIAHQVGKAHGGHFEIKSELGAGTVASFWLPILN
ncbi:MAG: ATP-binding protein, partial [Pseudomonadales bacterium]